MFLSGIADEAAPGIDGQIKAHTQWGVKHIEIRSIDGVNLTDVSNADFDLIEQKLEQADLQVSCFAAQIANWDRPIDDDFNKDKNELIRAIPRMQRLGTTFIRCMSYPNSDPPLSLARWRSRVIRRMKILAQMAEDGGVILVHENCDGWGGIGPEQTMELLAEVDSPALKLVFDTGNSAHKKHNLDSWEYYQAVKDETVYVHIKDYEEGGEEKACFAGDGCCHVRQIVDDLLNSGYDGGFSIEPHITSVIHKKIEADDPALAFNTYVQYGQHFQAMVHSIPPAH